MKDLLPQSARHRIQAVHAAAGESWYRIQDAAKEEAKVYIYDIISWFGIGADQFVRDLDKVTAKTIHVHINSPGGDVFEGLAIFNGLKNHPARVVAHIDGVAASIASVIAMGADEVHMSEGSFLMIHNAWWVVVGEAADMRKAADLLDKIGDSIAGIYANAAGKSIGEMLNLMAEETWFNPADALAIGFADKIEEAPAESAEAPGAKNAFDLSIYNHTPAELDRRKSAPAPAAAEKSPPQTKREYEKFLRDGGFSQSAAKALAAHYKEPESISRDEDGAADADVIAQIEATLARTQLAAILTR